MGETGQRPRRALITGISGQIGSYLAELLLARGYEVTGIVRGSPSQPYENLAGCRKRITLLQGDLLDQTTLLDAIHEARPDELYNLAGTSFVPASWKQPVMTAQFTAVGVTSMLEAIRIVDPGIRVFQASSSEIFGDSGESPQREMSPFRPKTPYGAAKLYAHLMVSNYRQRYGMYATSGILFNTESPRRAPEFVVRKVTRATAAIKLGLESELRLGSLDATRDWTYAGDAVEAIWLSLQAEEPDDFVISGGTSRSVGDLVATAFGHAGLDPDSHVVCDPELVRPAEAVPLVGDPTRAREKLGWSAKTSFGSLVADMVDHDLQALQDEAPS